LWWQECRQGEVLPLGSGDQNIAALKLHQQTITAVALADYDEIIKVDTAPIREALECVANRTDLLDGG
jgi:hypothetical protein